MKGPSIERRSVEGEDVAAARAEDDGVDMRAVAWCALRADGDELEEIRGRTLRQDVVEYCPGERARTRADCGALCKGGAVVDGEPEPSAL